MRRLFAFAVLICIFKETCSSDPKGTCSLHDVTTYAVEFQDCFSTKKFGDGVKNLENIVDRVMKYSRGCISAFARKCRPDFDGFFIMMDKVIYQLKDFCSLYSEYVTQKGDRIKDLQCVKEILSAEAYKSCFEKAWKDASSEEIFQQNAEKSIMCANKLQKGCSKSMKTNLNRIVRIILRVTEPSEENIEDDVIEEPRRRWYDYITQPLISLWGAVKSFFGF